MLNISLKNIRNQVQLDKYSSSRILEKRVVTKFLIKIMLLLFLLAFIMMFLPWTQNIRSKGYVTTLSPQDRPQAVQSLIGGRIEQWYVFEGQSVAKGDTIMKISESKQEYFDPSLVDNTKNQIYAKEESSKAYQQKANSLSSQYSALEEGLIVKLEQNGVKMDQVELKMTTDSLNLLAAETKQEIAKNQYARSASMFDSGLISLTSLEAKKLSLRESDAKVNALENKLNEHRNELINLNQNKQAIQSEFNDKLAKSRSEQMSALSSKYNADADRSKLESNVNSYVLRLENYFILSPINGVITKALQTGTGELIKQGEDIVTIMPDVYNLAIEMYVQPMDMPLLEIGQEVRVQFDGWPAIVFSGWPNSSSGTFGGKVFAIDNFISDNGMYRILVSEDPNERPWPEQVRVGGGANTITLLKNVKIWYEMWRQLNGFPPDYYKNEASKDIKTKAPLRKVK